MTDEIADFENRAATIRKRLMVRRGDRRIFVPLDTIDWIKAERNYVRIYVDEKSYLIKGPLLMLEESLPDPPFQRIQRSLIVNVNRVLEVTGSHGRYEVVLHGGLRLPLSRNYRLGLEEALLSA